MLESLEIKIKANGQHLGQFFWNPNNEFRMIVFNYATYEQIMDARYDNERLLFGDKNFSFREFRDKYMKYSTIDVGPAGLPKDIVNAMAEQDRKIRGNRPPFIRVNPRA